MTTTAQRTRGVDSSTPAAWRWMRVISAPERVVGTAIARPPFARRERLRHVDHAPPPSATSRSPADVSASISAAISSTCPPGTITSRSAAATTPGAASFARAVVSSV